MTLNTPGPSAPDDGRSGSTGVSIGGGAIATGAGVAALLAFVLQNTEDVPVSFLVWSFTWPVWLLIVVSAVLGAAIWLGLGVLRRHRRRVARRHERRD